MKKTQILGSCFALSLCATAYGQNRVEQSEQFQRRQEITAPSMRLESGTAVPELYTGENEDVGPQRVLQLRKRRTYFEVLVDSQFMWSDNVTLADNNKEESTIFVNTLEAAFAPSGLNWNGNPIEPRIGLRNQWYNYGLTPGGNDRFLGSLDFEAQTLFAEARYRFAGDWFALAGIEAQQLVDQFDYSDDFYSHIAPYFGFQWFRALSDTKALAASYRGSYHFSDTDSFFAPSDVNDRTDHSLTFSYSQELVPNLVLQPFYRFQYTYYTAQNERHETLHDLGISLAYHICKNASVRTFAGYQIKDTDDSKSVLTDYEKLDIGVGATFTIQF